MSFFNSYTSDNAPEKSKELLEQIEKKYGGPVPIFSDMAESPLPIKLYTFGQDLLMNEGTLSGEEVNLVQLAVSVQNECQFCVAAHSFAGRKQFKTDDAVIDAVRAGQDGPNEQFNALVTFAKTVVEKRGKLSESEHQAFVDAGYAKEQIFEVLSIAAYKTITNYTSQFAGTRPNGAMEEEAWSPSDLKAAA